MDAGVFHNERTSLHLASEEGGLDVVELLLREDGVDLNVKNKSGYTPLNSADITEHVEVHRLMREGERSHQQERSLWRSDSVTVLREKARVCLAESK